MERKEIAIGGESFVELVEQNCYYVDKTDFIKTVFGDSKAKVQLITRPRRFGKTFTMSTFESFLALNLDTPGDVSKQLKLFAGTHILGDNGTSEEVAARKRFVQDFMGKYPVISFSLKRVDGLNFKAAYEQFADTIVMLCEKFGYLYHSNVLSDEQKATLHRLSSPPTLRDQANAADLKGSLFFLTSWLTAHHGVAPVVLIDEYDVPLAKAEANGYYKEMLELLKAFLGALKTNDNFSRAVLTGCLRVSKESFFTGLNSFATNSVFDRDERFSSAIGFTKQETEAMLDYYDLGGYREQVKENYDGYRFGGISMFCPWDVLNFCNETKQLKAQGDEPDFKNYWTSTSGNDIIDEFADYIRPEHVEDMQTLVDGGSIAVKVRETLNYPDLENHEIDAFWTMLLFTGYLTVSAESSLKLKEPQRVRIPNLEIRDCFSDRILEHFKSNPQVVNDSISLAKACLKGDADTVEECLERKLGSFISIRDLSSKSSYEDIYHSFLNGCFSSCNGVIANYGSNKEEGDGYADISFSSPDLKTAVIIEIKRTDDEMRLDDTADEALRQIEEKHYAARYLARRKITSILAYGICFCRKSCSVSLKRLK